MGALISFLANFLAGASVAKFLATKAVLVALFTLVLPVILWNFSVDFTQAIFQAAFALLPVPPTVQQFTGMAGWFLTTAHIPEAVSVIVSSLAGRFVITSALRAL